MDLEEFNNGNEASFTALLDDNNTGTKGEEKDAFLDMPGEVQDHASNRNLRKAMTSHKSPKESHRRQQHRLPRRDKFQKPKLLGPLLEARFTRSYWRRLKHSSKSPNLPKNDENFLSRSDRKKLEIIAEPEELLTSSDKNHEDLFPESDQPWWEPDDTVESPSVGDKETERNDATANPTQNDTAMAAPASVPVHILSPRRVEECEIVLGAISLTLSEIVTSIDAADTSFGLTEDQIISLQTIVPTPAEKACLLKPPHDLHLGKGEEFLMQMIGVPDLEKKLQILLFQNQFPVSIERFCNDLCLFQKASEEILTSPRLDKVLGIVNLLGNRLVGKAPGKKKASKVSIPSLIEMLDKVEVLSQSSPSRETGEHSQPFLSYALGRIQRTNLSLLRLKEDMPLLHRVVDELNWRASLTELGELESNLEQFRRYVVISSAEPQQVDETTISVQEELDILEASKIGPTVIDFYLKMDGLYQVVDDTERYFESLYSHFRDDGNDQDRLDIATVLEVLARFCDSAEKLLRPA